MLSALALTFIRMENNPYWQVRARSCTASLQCSTMEVTVIAHLPPPKQQVGCWGMKSPGWTFMGNPFPMWRGPWPSFCSLQEGGSYISGVHHGMEGSLLVLAQVGPQASLSCWLDGRLHPPPHHCKRGEAEGKSFKYLHNLDLYSYIGADGNHKGQESSCFSVRQLPPGRVGAWAASENGPGEKLICNCPVTVGKRILHPSATAYTRYSTLTWRLSKGPNSLFWYKTPHRLPQGVSGPYEEIRQALGDAGRERDAPPGMHFPRRSWLLDKAL